MAPTADPGTRGLLFVIAALCLLPVAFLAVALVPEGARLAVFWTALLLVAVVAGRGGWVARTGVVEGGPHLGRALAGAIAGLSLAVTCGLIVLWTSFGRLVG